LTGLFDTCHIQGSMIIESEGRCALRSGFRYAFKETAHTSVAPVDIQTGGFSLCCHYE
jgi:hypothetical protein